MRKVLKNCRYLQRSTCFPSILAPFTVILRRVAKDRPTNESYTRMTWISPPLPFLITLMHTANKSTTRRRLPYFPDNKIFHCIAQYCMPPKIPVRHSRAFYRSSFYLPDDVSPAKQANKKKVIKYPSFIVKKKKERERNERGRVKGAGGRR